VYGLLSGTRVDIILYAPGAYKCVCILIVMLNGIYRFQGFLEDTLSFAPEEAKLNRDSCVSLFEKVYPALLEQDFRALAWEQFPLVDMKQS